MIKKNKIIKLFMFLPAIIWMTLITYLSSQSQLPDVQELFKHADKLAHFFVYFILGIFLILGTNVNMNKSIKIRMLIVVLIGSSFAFIDEFHQSFVPNRVPDLFDFLANIIGIFLSLVLFKFISRIIMIILNKINIK